MLTTIIVFAIILSVLILVHEFGHYIVAKKAGVWVEEFGFGLPPRIFGRKIGETIYSVNWLPIGGFVKLHGESTGEGVTKPNRAFLNRNKRTRIGIIVAGVVMNFILATVAFGVVYSFSGIPKPTDNVVIADVVSGTPAQEAGLLVGDKVVSFADSEVDSTEKFLELIAENKGKRVAIELQREVAGVTSVEALSVTPRIEYPDDEGSLGVVVTSVEIYFPPVWQRPFVGIYYGFQEALFWGGAVVMGFVKIISDLFIGVPPKDLAGPVGIFALTSQATAFGALAVINFVGILSVNLAILNIVPFPALDGGRLLFIGIESLFGRRVVPRIESTIHAIGMAVLLILILAITVKDIKGLVDYGGISGFLNSLLQQ